MGVAVQLHLFLLSALGVGESSISRPDDFNSQKEPRYKFNVGLGEPRRRSGLWGEEKKKS